MHLCSSNEVGIGSEHHQNTDDTMYIITLTFTFHTPNAPGSEHDELTVSVPSAAL